jgi:hypothetical protein
MTRISADLFLIRANPRHLRSISAGFLLDARLNAADNLPQISPHGDTLPESRVRTMKFQIGAMSVGDILDRGLRLLLARLPALYTINLIVLLPIIAYQLLLPLLLGEEAELATAALVSVLGSFGVIILTLILQPIGAAAILHVISQEFVDRHVGIGDAFQFAFSRFLSLLGASFVAGLIIGVGMMLCCVPGLIFWTWYAFVAQVVVVERLSAMASLDRSRRLGEGYFGRILGVLLLIALLTGVIPLLLGIGLGIFLPASETVPVAGGGFRIVTHYGNQVVHVLVAYLAQMVFGAYQAVCLTLLYFDLRIRKEGYDLEMAVQGQEDVPLAELDEPEVDLPDA